MQFYQQWEVKLHLNLCIEADEKGIWDDFNDVKLIGVDIRRYKYYRGS